MTFLKLRKIIREIVQSEIEPEPRGGGEQENQSSMGIWHSEKGPMYREKDKKFPYLWHIKEKEDENYNETGDS